MNYTSEEHSDHSTPPVESPDSAVPAWIAEQGSTQAQQPAGGSPRPSGAALGLLLRPLLAPVLALGGWLLYRQLFLEGPLANELIVRLFQPAGPVLLRFVPDAILFLFLWVLADGLLLLVGQQRTWWSLTRLQAAPDPITPPAGLAMLIPLGMLKAELEESQDPSQLQERHRHRLEIEQTRLGGRYATAQLFLWAMPILGFIGTVLGIGAAVGGFSSFLGTDIEDLENIKQGLAGVAGGLSYAFDTTLLGLACSLIGMLGLAALQQREEALLVRIEELGLGWIAQAPAAIQAVATAPLPVSFDLPALEAFRSHLAAELALFHVTQQELAKAWEVTTHELLGSLQQVPAMLEPQQRVLAETLQAYAQLVNQLQQSSEVQQGAASMISGHLAGHEARLAGLQEASQTTTELLKELVAQQQRLLHHLEQWEGGLEVRLVPSLGPAENHR